MSSEVQNITSIDEIWAKIEDPALRQEWEDMAVDTAAADPKIQTMIGLLPHYKGAATAYNMHEKIDEVIAHEYEAVPAGRIDEVFAKVGQLLIRREQELDGEA